LGGEENNVIERPGQGHARVAKKGVALLGGGGASVGDGWHQWQRKVDPARWAGRTGWSVWIES